MNKYIQRGTFNSNFDQTKGSCVDDVELLGGKNCEVLHVLYLQSQYSMPTLSRREGFF